MRHWRRSGSFMVALVLIAAACGGDGDGSEGGTSSVRPATVVATAMIQSATPTAGGATLNAIQISAENTAFSVDTREAAAGEITIEFNHRDDGVAHNFAVYPSEDELDSPIAATAIETGPTQQELRLTLEPGEYFYRCDVHPAQMTGTLVVR